MKDIEAIVTVMAIALAMLIVGAMGYRAGSASVTSTKETREHRAIELELADVKARLATLERVRIEVNLNDRTGTWFVLNGKVQ